MFETGSLDWVRSDRGSVNSSSRKRSFLVSRALGYIEELFTLLNEYDNVQISENISEEFENIKVRIKEGKVFFALSTSLSLSSLPFPVELIENLLPIGK